MTPGTDEGEGVDAESAHPLDNAVWHALRTSHRHLAEGDGGALRYPAEISPFHAVDRLDAGGWAALATLAGPDRVLVLFRDQVGSHPPGWAEVMSGTGHQMVAAGPLDPPPALDVRPLGPADAEQMLALVQLTQPGPFGRRTVELGGYVGVFEDERLVAMAGERMRLPGHAEISAVCTHPDARGRGLAAALTLHVADGIRQRGETPFLHVARGNDSAERIYERLGFQHRRVVRFAVLRSPAEDVTG